MDLDALAPILARFDERFGPSGLFLWKHFVVPGKKSVGLRLFIDRLETEPAEGRKPVATVSHVDCIAVSRWLTETLDAELPELDYSLEVSSPGAERPLESLDDIRRFRGRRAKLTLVYDGVPVTWTGALGAAAATGDTFEFVPDRQEPVTLAFSEIQKAHLSIV